MRVKKGAKRLFRIIFITAVVIILVGVGILGYKRFFDKGKEPVKPEIVDKLDDYGYSLEKDATKLDKEMFNELKKTLNKEEVDEEAPESSPPCPASITIPLICFLNKKSINFISI